MSTMVELLQLIEHDIPEGRHHLKDSHNNLEKVAAYCEGNYLQAQDKPHALKETKSYTTQSLASVAYQINTLATNFLHLLDLQNNQLKEMESSVSHLSQTVMIHKEKVARREIGVLTTNKTTSRPQGVKNPGIIFPDQPERAIKYVRKPIDYSILDEVGHGVKQVAQSNPRSRRASSGSSKSSTMSSTMSAGQAPTTKPPTPPSMMRGGTLTRQTSSPYRTPAPPVSPPSVPSHYAPGHYQKSQMEAREAERRSGYAAIGSVQMIPVLPANAQNGYSPGMNRPTAQPPPPPTQQHQQHMSPQQQQQQQQHLQVLQQSPQRVMQQTAAPSSPPVSPGYRTVSRPSARPPPPPAQSFPQNQVVQVLPTLHNGYGSTISRSHGGQQGGQGREPSQQQVAQVPPTMPGGYGQGMQAQAHREAMQQQQQQQQQHLHQQQMMQQQQQQQQPHSTTPGTPPISSMAPATIQSGPTLQTQESYEPPPPPPLPELLGNRAGNVSPPLPSPPLPSPPASQRVPPPLNITSSPPNNSHGHVTVVSMAMPPRDEVFSPPPLPSPVITDIPFADEALMDNMDNLSPPLPPPPEHSDPTPPVSHYEDNYGTYSRAPPVHINFSHQGPPSTHLPGQRRGPPFSYGEEASRREDGQPDWVPKNYLEKVVAIYDYTKDKEDELSFTEGAIIYVIKQNDDGWWEGVMDGVTGLFPGNYVDPV